MAVADGSGVAAGAVVSWVVASWARAGARSSGVAPTAVRAAAMPSIRVRRIERGMEGFLSLRGASPRADLASAGFRAPRGKFTFVKGLALWTATT